VGSLGGPLGGRHLVRCSWPPFHPGSGFGVASHCGCGPALPPMWEGATTQFCRILKKPELMSAPYRIKLPKISEIEGVEKHRPWDGPLAEPVRKNRLTTVFPAFAALIRAFPVTGVAKQPLSLAIPYLMGCSHCGRRDQRQYTIRTLKNKHIDLEQKVGRLVGFGGHPPFPL